MKKKTLVLCIAMGLSNNSTASVASLEEVSRDCPINSEKMTEEERKYLPEECLKQSGISSKDSWIIAGMASIAAAIGISLNSDSDSHPKNSNPSEPNPSIPSEPNPSIPVVIKDTAVSGSGSVGTSVVGDNITISNDSSMSVSDGAIGVSVSGDNVVVNNTGDSVASGAASIGTAIIGNSAQVNQVGSTTVENGASGVVVKGDNTSINHTGNTSASGAGSAGIVVTGNNTQIDQTGSTVVESGAIGIQISGDNANVNNQGKITAVGAGTIGLSVNGDNAVVDLTSGLLDVRESAVGVQMAGSNSTLNNRDKIQVRDSGSVGIDIKGSGNRVNTTGNIDVTHNGTGLLIEGEKALVNLDGSVDVTAVKDDTGILQTGQGVILNGHSNQVEIAGNVNVSNEIIAVEPGDEAVSTGLQGVGITGNNNEVNVKGSVNLARKGNIVSTIGSIWSGIAVNGQDNYVSVDGGINVSIEGGNQTGNVFTVGLLLDGENRVDVSGRSSFQNMEVRWTGSSAWANVLNGGQLLLTSDSVLDIKGSVTGTGSRQVSGALIASGQNSHVENAGVINVEGPNIALSSSNGGLITNSGTINSLIGDGLAASPVAVMQSLVDPESLSGGHALNTGNINITSTVSPVWSASSPSYPIVWFGNTIYGLVSLDGNQGQIENQGTITLNGAGLYGMGARNSATVLNSGTINVDGFIPTLDAEGNVTSKSAPLTDMRTYLRSTGMQHFGVGSSINTGTINVNNMGFGMLADEGGTVLNAGTINLTADSGISNDGTGRQLVGIVALNNSEAINDRTGKIIIDSSADTLAQPFYKEGTGTIVNRGLICVGNANTCSDAPTYNPTDPLVSNIYDSGDILTIGGQTSQLDNMAFLRGEVSNAGIVSGSTITIGGSGTLTNMDTGSIANGIINNGGSLINNGIVDGALSSTGGSIINSGVINGSTSGVTNTTFTNTAYGIVNNNTMLRGNSVGINEGTLNQAAYIYGNTVFTNNGTINDTVATWGSVAADNSTIINNGTVNVDKTNARGLSVNVSGKAINGVTGVINVGSEGTKSTNMTGMLLQANSNAKAMVLNQGIINVNASNSYAFSKEGANGRIINTGTVNFADGITGSGLIRQPGVSPETTLPDDVTLSTVNRNVISGYTVGTSADGSAGMLRINNAILTDVAVDTGFTAGTAATTMTFSNVVQGKDILGAENIRSSSVVWDAQGESNDQGNVDIVMTKKAYVDVVSQSSLSGVAGALDASYTNNALFNSLNVSSVSELNNALSQVSGNQANTAFNEARKLSNRFNLLSDEAPLLGDGLAFNVVAKGDKRAELGNKTHYDMAAIRQSLSFDNNQSLELTYGIARLSGDGAERAGDNGVTGGYSQFFGIKHGMPVGETGMNWSNSLRYDRHNLDSSRSIHFGNVNKVASASSEQHNLEFRSQAGKEFEIDEGVKLTPYAGMKIRHILNEGYDEKGAVDFNLRLSSGSETAVDSLAGLKLEYTGKNGWGASTSLEAGPNMAYTSKRRTASLAGAAGKRFNLRDSNEGGGMNGLAQAGVKYSSENVSFGADAYQWKEGGVSDQGFKLNLTRNF